MKPNKFILLLLILCSTIFPQKKLEEDINRAFQNAKKGVYWALTNIPEKKQRVEQNLIAEDQLYSTVKLKKSINGIMVESTGFYLTNQVSIVIYKSNDSLIEEGYLERKEIENTEEKGEPDED